MSENWYYHDGKSPVGPFTKEKLCEFLNKDILKRDTLAWREGTDAWVLLSTVFPAEFAIERPHFPDVRPETKSGLLAAPSSGPANLSVAMATEDQKWLAKPVTPWRRCAARMLDTNVNGTAFFLLFGFAMFFIAPYEADRLFRSFDGPGGRALDILLTSFVGCLLSGLFTGMTGFSLGKLIFGVKVLDLDGRLLGISAGISRDLTVWIKGIGLGIPILSLITMIVGHQTLSAKGAASWDEGRYVVLHRKSGLPQYILNVLGVVLWLATLIFLAFLNQVG